MMVDVRDPIVTVVMMNNYGTARLIRRSVMMDDRGTVIPVRMITIRLLGLLINTAVMTQRITSCQPCTAGQDSTRMILMNNGRATLLLTTILRVRIASKLSISLTTSRKSQ